MTLRLNLKMGISLMEWRITIGVFHSITAISNEKRNTHEIALLLARLLLQHGDVESNPGPADESKVWS